MSNASSTSSYYERNEERSWTDSLLYPHPPNAPANSTSVAAQQRDISVRRLRPTLATVDLGLVAHLADNWQHTWATDGEVLVSNDGTGQYSLIGSKSHHIFYAGLVLAKYPRPAALRCAIIPRAVNLGEQDLLERNGHVMTLTSSRGPVDGRLISTLRSMLGPRGYKFAM